MPIPITVVGCGVAGLTCGLRLLEAGFELEILARELPPHTTSNKAPAIWYPYLAQPRNRIKGWARSSYEEYQRLTRERMAGVSMVELIEVTRETSAASFWREYDCGFRRLPRDEIPNGYADGFAVQVPFVQSSQFLEYLVGRVRKLGGTITRKEVSSLLSIAPIGSISVNCSGLGARFLAQDDAVFPIRGQVVLVDIHKTLPYVTDDEERDFAHIFPRQADCVLGGTAEAGDWRQSEDEETTRKIIERCLALEPRLKGYSNPRAEVGLRPGRNEVRLETEKLAEGGTVVHNYGHGGAGFSVCWGCADEVVELVKGLLEV